jgi:hypothetical protein
MGTLLFSIIIFILIFASGYAGLQPPAGNVLP